MWSVSEMLWGLWTLPLRGSMGVVSEWEVVRLMNSAVKRALRYVCLNQFLLKLWIGVYCYQGILGEVTTNQWKIMPIWSSSWTWLQVGVVRLFLPATQNVVEYNSWTTLWNWISHGIISEFLYFTWAVLYNVYINVRGVCYRHTVSPQQLRVQNGQSFV